MNENAWVANGSKEDDNANAMGELAAPLVP